MGKQSSIRFTAFVATILVVACTLAYVGFQDVPGTTRPFAVDSLGPDAQCIVAPEDDARELLVRDIRAARVSVLVECYLISDREVVNALRVARGNGCVVRVLMEQFPFGGFSVNDSVRGEMRASGIEAAWGNPAYSFTHAKFVVVDQSIVWLMTANLTQAAFDSNRDVFIRTRHARLAADLRRVFQADSQRIPCRAGRLVLSPGNARTQISLLLSSAHTSVDIATEVLDDWELETLLMEACARGVRIRLLVADPDSIPINEVSAGRLRKTGVNVRYLTSPYLHAKYIVTDNEFVYVGSHNMSTGSLDENRETGVISNNRAVVGSLETSFFSDWQSGD